MARTSTRTISPILEPRRSRGSHTASSRRAALERLEWVANIMDSAIILPGNIRIGVDAAVGLLPGIGDTITTLVSVWMIKEAHALGVPKHILTRMAGNVAVDTLLGIVPVLGDAFDIFWRSNLRNMKLLREHFEREGFD
jgi:hypothetical protein